MYNEHFGLTQAPFRITPDTGVFYTGGGRGDVLEALVYAISSGEGIIKVTGEVGTGKTMLCRMLEHRLPANVDLVYLANPSLSPDDIVQAIALELGIVTASGGSRIELVFQLQQNLVQRHAQNRRVVVLVEEAQSMPIATLEEVRLLSNLETKREKLLQIVLFGQPELEDLLGKPEIRQLRERITHSFRLSVLAPSEIRDYVNFRLRASGYRGREAFSANTWKIMSRASEGLTRRVNILADKALLAAYADDTHDVGKRHVNVAVRDSAFTRAHKLKFGSLAAVAAVALISAGVGWFGGHGFNGLGVSALFTADATEPAVLQVLPEPELAAAQSASQAGRDVAVEALANATQASSPTTVANDGLEANPVTILSTSPARGDAMSGNDVVIGTPSVAPVNSDAAQATVVPESVNRQAVAEPDAASPIVRTVLAALSDGDSTMLAPPPVPTNAMTARRQRIPEPPGPATGELKQLAVDPASDVTAVTAPPPPASKVPGDLLEQRLGVTKDWLVQVNRDRYTVQLLATHIRERLPLLEFLSLQFQRGILQDIYVYPTQFSGRSWYSVIFGSFSSRAEAEAAMSGLPRDLTRHGPFVRRLRDLRVRG